MRAGNSWATGRPGVKSKEVLEDPMNFDPRTCRGWCHVHRRECLAYDFEDVDGHDEESEPQRDELVQVIIAGIICRDWSRLA